MIRNPFGIHFIPVHQGQPHYDFIAAAEPGVVKLVSGNGAPDVQMMATMYECAPEAIHVYRNHPLSEQHDDLWRDPIGTAVRHVSNWQSDLRNRRDEAVRRGLALPPMEQTMTLGINEPIIELLSRNEDMSNYSWWLAMVQQRTAILDNYMATYVWESKKYGQPCGVGNFSGGQPANLKPGAYATYDWFPKTRKALEGNRGFASLVVHEYWDIQGPGEMVDWWTYRWMHCDWDTDIYVLECGVDRAIRSATFEGNRGWNGHMTAQRRADQTLEYIRNCRRDPRFKAATDFTLDGDKMWWSFWIDNCMPEMLGVSEKLRSEMQGQPASKPTVDTRIPLVVKPAVGSGVTLDVLNVRLGPGTDYPATRMLWASEPVTWTAVSGDWLQIGPNEWVHGRYVGPKPPPSPRPPSGPTVPPTPVSPPTSPMSEEQAWQRVHRFTLRMEGGLSTDPTDRGNYRPDGTFVGTKYGISANAHPEEDIVNLSKERALQIYHEQYWRATGISSLPWPLCLIAFEAAVNQGRGTAKQWLQESGGNLWRFMALRQRAYTKAGTWQHHGEAWMVRMADLMDEIAR